MRCALDNYVNTFCNSTRAQAWRMQNMVSRRMWQMIKQWLLIGRPWEPRVLLVTTNGSRLHRLWKIACFILQSSGWSLVYYTIKFVSLKKARWKWSESRLMNTSSCNKDKHPLQASSKIIVGSVPITLKKKGTNLKILNIWCLKVPKKWKFQNA